MITIHFTQEDQDLLFEKQAKHAHPLVRKKMLALYLKSLNLAHGKICEVCRISRPTLASYLSAYQSDGIAALEKLNYPTGSSSLDPHREKILDNFDDHPPHTVNEAVECIDSLVGIRLSPSAVRDWMRKNGLKYLKSGVVPGKSGGCPEEKAKEREVFVNEKLNPRLQEAEAGERAVLFVDAAHFVYGNFISYLWCFVRIFIPSANGRQRFNVLGAIDAVSKEILTFTNTDYINALSVVELLKKVKEKYTIPVTLVLDNARYQRCKLVMGKAEEMGIELLFLPSYSPQLNLIERFWKFTKKKCLYGKFYQNFDLFKENIDQFIKQANLSYKEEMDRLLSWNFQTFNNVKFLTV